VTAFLSPNKDVDYPAYCESTRTRFLGAVQQLLLSSDLAARGPFVVGERFTYADIVLYQILHDEELTRGEQKGLKEYGRLVKLVDAVEAREGVKKFLASDRYLG
jgi:glutathione S-transferase